MSGPEQALRARNLRTLFVLAGLFLLPLALAFFTYYGTSWRPAARVNHGTLITPPRPLPPLQLPYETLGASARDGTPALRGVWSLLYVQEGACGQSCQGALYFMRQTRLALNADMTRVERVLVVTGRCCERAELGRAYPGLVLIDAAGEAGAALRAALPAPDEHTVFVVDPLGNLMMSYDVRDNPRGLLEDLKKLLRLSHIG
ncbi:MAG TPA: hypothetical protein VH109_03890 [Steroidobacteraceae bacterium]|nr:hypothetical protein [Steroidobacteraceae bacterium]